MSTSGGVQYTEGIPWVHQGNIVTHVGEQIDKSV